MKDNGLKMTCKNGFMKKPHRISYFPHMRLPMKSLAKGKAVAVLACLAFASCIQNAENPAPDKTSEKHLISGRLFYVNGTPVAGGTVTIRASNFLSDTSRAIAKRAADTLVVKTDGEGAFSIDSIGMGSYLLEGRDKTDSVAMIEPVAIEGTHSSITLIDTLKKPGALRGKVALSEGEDPRKVFVLPFGVNRFALPDSNGNFELAGLPEGVYTLRIMTPLDYRVMDISGVAVVSGGTADIGRKDLVFNGVPSVKNVTTVCDSMKSEMTVSWDQLPVGKATGYYVYRKHNDSVFVRMNKTPVSGPPYIDSASNGIIPGDRYVYTVVSLDSLGNESERKHSASVEASSVFHPIQIGIPPIPCASGCDFNVAPDGSVWLTNVSGTVLHYDSSGAVIGNWTSLVESGGFGFDFVEDADSSVYVLHRDARVLEKLDRKGSSIWKLSLPFNRYALELHKVGDTLVVWGKEERAMARVSLAGGLISYKEIQLSASVANYLEYSPAMGYYILFGSEIWMVGSDGEIASKWSPMSHGALQKAERTAAGNWILSWSTGLVEFYDPGKKLLANLVLDSRTNLWSFYLRGGKIYVLGFGYGDFRLFRSDFLTGF